jgi:uncharacterized protein YlxP (DUF503 family)
MARISVAISQSHSLKDKRMVVRRIKDRVRDRVGVVVNEVGELDIWQRAELGCAVTSGERRKALELLDEVIRVIGGIEGGAIIAVAKDAITFDADGPASNVVVTRGEPALADVVVDDRTGAGDKAAAVAGDDWVPDAWKDAT